MHLIRFNLLQNKGVILSSSGDAQQIMTCLVGNPLSRKIVYNKKDYYVTFYKSSGAIVITRIAEKEPFQLINLAVKVRLAESLAALVEQLLNLEST